MPVSRCSSTFELRQVTRRDIPPMHEHHSIVRLNARRERFVSKFVENCEWAAPPGASVVPALYCPI
jgi:hypothetical protein